MNDGSILSLASRTKLELNKSVYDQKKKSRSSFLNMVLGKARFLVVKLLKFKRTEFKVKT
ncbi:MAG: FecR domain-containing protein, partial [Deltaproteobacteria bacterium]|nr:FecR domain-containing protein [Deltaproteobacteria bacterium]